MCILYVFNQKRDVLIAKLPLFPVTSYFALGERAAGNAALAFVALLSDYYFFFFLVLQVVLPLRFTVSLFPSSFGKGQS